MKKTLITLLIVFLSFPSVFADSSLELTLSQVLLDLSQEYNPNFNSQSNQIIPLWVEELNSSNVSKASFNKQVREWERFLFSEKKVEYDSQRNILNLNPFRLSDKGRGAFSSLFLDSVIKNRKAGRLGLAGLWAALAEETGEPFHLILAPRYPLVMIQTSGVSKAIDVGIRRRTYSLDYFKTQFSWSENETTTAYFRALSSKEVKVIFLNAVAKVMAFQNQLEVAGDILREAVEMFPDNPEIKSDLGWVYLEQGLKEEARKQFLEAEQLYSNDEVAIYGLMNLYWDEGDTSRCEQYLEKILALYPDDLGVLRKMIMVKLIRMGLVEAEGYIHALLELRPEDSEGVAYQATLQYLRGYRQKAQQQFDISLKKGVADASTLLAHGLRYLFLGIYSDPSLLWNAMEYFRKAEVENSSLWSTSYFISLVYYNSGQFERALANFQKVIAMAPASSESMIGIAQSLMALGKYVQAQLQINEVKELDPNNPNVSYAQSILYFRTGQTGLAIQEIKKAIQNASYFEKEGWNLQLVQFYIEEKRWKEAVKVNLKVLKRNPYSFKAYELQGNILLELNRVEEAKRNLKIAYKYLPKNGQVLKLMAKAAYQEKDYPTAWKYLRAAQRSGVNDPEFIADLKQVSKE